VFINRDFFIAVVKEIAEVREVEIGCDECFEQVDRFIEVELSGLDAAQAMPLVQEHLEICGECREEFGVLLMALQATEEASSSPDPTALDRLLRGIHHPPAP
jgi:predicted anti-sigma-YlaC factor YlaD